MACVVASSPGWELRANMNASLVVECGNVRKTTERMVTQLQRRCKDAKAVGEALRKLSKQSRVTQVQVFQQLLEEHNRELAVPVYDSLRKQHWYTWSPTSHARLAALLAEYDRSEETYLLLQTPENLSIGQELDLQICLLFNYGKHGHLDKALAIFDDLQSYSNPDARSLSYRALLQVYAHLNQPHEAYLILQQMKTAGCVLSLDDYKAVLYKFGIGGHFPEMESLVLELHRVGLKLDLSGFNMKLSAYAQAMKFESVRETLDTMRSSSVPCSVNSCNAISKSCTALISELEKLEELPLSEASLFECFDTKNVSDEELQLVRQLVRIGIPSSSVRWEENAWELDLHQMFVGTALLMVLLWFLQLRACLGAGKKLPRSVKIVTGWGKHNGVSRKSLILHSTRKLLDRLQSPFVVDKQNRGVLSCRSPVLVLWLLRLDGL